jgi:hypothetical protein
MKLKLSVLLIGALCILLLQNCKEKDNTLPNPCAGKTLPVANFILAEKLEGEERYFETDKINFVNDLFLRGPDGYKQYLWLVGTNENWSTQKNAKVSFSQAEGKLRVRLIATREPMTDCFADDDGVDTIEKWIDVINKSQDKVWISPLQGTWEGKSTQFGDKIYTIEFASKDSLDGGTGDWNNFLYNLTNGCSSDYRTFAGFIVWKGQASYTRRKPDTADCVFNYVAYTFPYNKDSIIVEYEVEGPPPAYKFIPYIFTGKRK